MPKLKAAATRNPLLANVYQAGPLDLPCADRLTMYGLYGQPVSIGAIWIIAPSVLVPSDGVFGRFDLVALRGCHQQQQLSSWSVESK
jgi:hypothetical protein